ncbi:uncharacterized protein SPPG_09390 [Spizellomyces punctatus DAOM BR117]|uniref:Uncharacterized protein n=1 Tax=Spizellomyces punctatus (strain DAOM BR117) TaxID=645134 RepID=A0A0L0HB82_SPIPD|nr:uncharacterized protein SPPG_09390 [Spizellomyces punctatus DAOM BR117]KNC98186.1 hypothetical protein SPPG_09390 [Spizellomyces punctatus DAOM BR117]|eukprot:XP_016606226.1 hypothetical protein SPPG_09390 [Spizellomyces punctatus DAOM BR117]
MLSKRPYDQLRKQFVQGSLPDLLRDKVVSVSEWDRSQLAALKQVVEENVPVEKVVPAVYVGSEEVRTCPDNQASGPFHGVSLEINSHLLCGFVHVAPCRTLHQATPITIMNARLPN